MQIDMKFMRSTKSAQSSDKRWKACKDFSNPSIISGKSNLLRDCSPGHLEFWFFGWSPKYYRPHFALYPLPAFVTIPYILHYINQVQDKLVTPTPVVVDIRPEFETMIIKQRKKNHFTEVVPFISRKHLDELSSIAHKVAVDSSFEDEYPSHVQSAFEKAREYYAIYDDRKSRDGSYKRNRRMRKRNLTNKE